MILNDTKKRMPSYSIHWFFFLIGQSFCANQHFQTRSSLLSCLPVTVLKYSVKGDQFIVLRVALAKYCKSRFMSWCPIVACSPRPSSVRGTTWERLWPRRSPRVESLARVRASHSKSGSPQRNVPSVLGWRCSLCRCSTQGDGTCPSASQPSLWSVNKNKNKWECSEGRRHVGKSILWSKPIKLENLNTYLLLDLKGVLEKDEHQEMSESEIRPDL